MSRSASSRKMKKKPMKKLVPSWRWQFAGIILVFGVAIALLAFHAYAQSHKNPEAGPVSRQVLLETENEIRQTKPGPTLGALYYAYVAGVYNDALNVSSQADALDASRYMLVDIFPQHVSQINRQITTISDENDLQLPESPSKLNSMARAVLDKYQHRFSNDGHVLAWDGTKPSGPDKWSSLIGSAPITPRAGDWKRWNVSRPISVPAPPVYGSAEDSRQIALVEQAVAKRNGQDINLINFWAGQPGSETPGGIWQNVMFEKVKEDISADAITSDKQYAVLQKTLAETISDAFMECWKVKYAYWTARPDMRIPGISTAMDDPNFPGYVSGHATISKAAADVLSVIIPRYAKDWEADADQARYSRLVAGIHFDSDNAGGYIVGSSVARQYVSSLHLQKEL